MTSTTASITATVADPSATIEGTAKELARRWGLPYHVGASLVALLRTLGAAREVGKQERSVARKAVIWSVPAKVTIHLGGSSS